MSTATNIYRRLTVAERAAETDAQQADQRGSATAGVHHSVAAGLRMARRILLEEATPEERAEIELHFPISQ